MKQSSAMAFSLNHDGTSNAKERGKKPTRHRGNGFGEFPLQMSTPEITTPRVTNTQNEPQSRIRFADDTKLPQSSGQRKRVLVLGPSSDEQTPSTSPLQANSLDFSMIATPGGAKLTRSIGHNYRTPSEEGTSSTVSSAIWPAGTPFSNLLRGVVSSTPNVDPRRIFSATPYTAARETLSLQDEREATNNLDQNGNQYNALTFARAAPLSGYLRKLGKNIPTFKRRFFVLKPSTHLYYFMSPTDVEPRGCIDLDLVRENGERGGCEVREIGVLPDGTFRFELLFQDEDVDDETQSADNGRLEDANSNTSHMLRKGQVEKQSIVLEARTEEIGREWMGKLQTERLSTARDEIDFLKATLAEMKATSSRWEQIAEDEQMRADAAEKKQDTASLEAKYWEEKFNDLNKAVGLLSDLVTSDVKSDDMFSSDLFAQSIEGLDLDGTNFLRVSKAFKTIHDNHIGASEDAEDERKRADEIEKRLKESESRLAKVEAELCQVWEDNCAIQKELKKEKREKKVLVREVRAQRAKASNDSQKNILSTKQDSSCASTEQSLTQKKGSKCDDSEATSLPPKTKMNSEQQRLVIELEEHVMSGLRLSEQFLTLNGIEPSVVGDDLDSCMQPSHSSPVRNTSHHPLHEAGVPTKLCSLLDDDSIDDSTLPNDDEDSTTVADQSAKQSDVFDTQLLNSESTTEATSSHGTHDIDHSNDASVHKLSIQHIKEAQAPEDPFAYYRDLLGEKPVNQNLNDRFSEALSPTNNNIQHDNTQSEQNSIDHTRPSRITETGHATSKLACPLRDVGETPRSYPPGSALGEDNEVYHITFYSAKIGLQFQKVPVENASVGLLTDAMTADLGVNRTALDLERIATISRQSQNASKSKKLSVECPPVRPVDMVLVCGFVGFDESTGNIRPRIGARLVAFDGIPVEVGKWTFESIRKSIQARGRPLTLSFRNDFLTPKQREILTKAVNDVNGYDEQKPSSATIFRGSGREVEETEKKSAIISKSSSVSSNSHKYYSLSEAGSSITSAVAPLVSNLMTGISAGTRKREEFTPDYLRRPSSSLDEMKHHHDFQSGLL